MLPIIKKLIYFAIKSYPSVTTILLALVNATKNPNPRSTIKIINNFQSSFGYVFYLIFFQFL